MNALIEEFTPRAAGHRCGYGPCQCIVQAKEIYCSEHCQQAAAQGIERDYCQCEHEHAPKQSDLSVVQTWRLPEQHQLGTDHRGGA